MVFTYLAILVGFVANCILAGRDLYDRKIPNFMVYPLLAVALALVVARFVESPTWTVPLSHLTAFLLFGLAWSGIFAAGGCGGGDVKLMAANALLLGVFVGTLHILFALVAALAYLLLLLALRIVVASVPGATTACLAGFVAQHRRPEPPSGSPEMSGRTAFSPVAIPFAVPSALGYAPLVAGIWWPQFGWALR